MAWRLDKSVVRGEIDNRRRDCVLGRIWLAGRTQPIELALHGNCCRDIAGCRLTFRNPRPREGAENVRLHRSQRGVVGDMTASRKVRVFDVPVERALEMARAGHSVPEHMGNCLYLEWFSERNGRVVIEATDYELQVSTAAWHMSANEEHEQQNNNYENLQHWMTDLSTDAPETPIEPIEPDEPALHEGPMDEFEWEQVLRDSDARNEKYTLLFEKYLDHPDREKIIAREMGWTEMEEALEEVECGEFCLEDNEPEPVEELRPNPITEGVEWIRTEEGRIRHPLVDRAFRVASRTWETCKRHGLLGESGDEDLRDMIFNAQTLSAKLAGALNSLAYEHRPENGFVVACLKRALKYFDQSLGAGERVRRKKIVASRVLDHFCSELFLLRQEMLALMEHFRRQQR